MTLTEAAPLTIVEVGPRGGLQNEQRVLPTAAKLAFIERSPRRVCAEAVSFVNPGRDPQMADAETVMDGVRRIPGCATSAQCSMRARWTHASTK
jgi:hydroxymethylglutaryl-CoA lyase